MTDNTKKTSIFEPIKRVSLRQKLVETILTKIFKGELSGGDRLVERDLAEQLGVSRTPIREALAELSAVGMVQTNSKNKVVVRPFTELQLKNIYQVRQILESHATSMACPKIEHRTLHLLRDELTALLNSPSRTAKWSNKALSLDQRLHQLLSEECGNERLSEEIARYRNLVHALRLAAKNAVSSQAKALESHLAIIDALLAGNPTLAASKMEEHIAEAARDAIATVFQTGSDELNERYVKSSSKPVHSNDSVPKTGS